MGIRFTCPNGHKLHVKAFLAGKRGVCPQCGAKILIPNVPDEAEPVVGGGGLVGPMGPLSPGRAGSPTGTASPSIIIQVAEPSATSDTPHVGPSELELEPPRMPAEIAALSHGRSPIDQSPSSPAARYVAQRERNRRNQVTLAILLLVGVIVLAIVLILVLQRGSSTPSTTIRPPSLEHGSDTINSTLAAL